MEQSAIGRGSGGNVIAALASLVSSGTWAAGARANFFGAASGDSFSYCWVLSFGLLGWVGHILASLDAALWRGPR